MSINYATVSLLTKALLHREINVKSIDIPEYINNANTSIIPAQHSCRLYYSVDAMVI